MTGLHALELAGPGTTRLPVLVPTAGLLKLDFAVVRRHLRLHQAYDVSAMLGDVFSTYEYSAWLQAPEGFSLTFLTNLVPYRFTVFKGGGAI